MQYDVKPIFYPRWQQYNTCLAAPSVTRKGHRKIEPKAKHFSHCKKDQSSRPNQTDNSKRLAKITNHTYKNSDKIKILFIDKLDHKPTIHRSQQTHRKRRLHRIDLHKRGGEHCIEIQKERGRHLANNYVPEGLR